MTAIFSKWRYEGVTLIVNGEVKFYQFFSDTQNPDTLVSTPGVEIIKNKFEEFNWINSCGKVFKDQRV